MRQIFIESLRQNVSALGFGYASLGSRVSAKQGRRALDQAFDRGISWFDTAPPYGDGASERILGSFLKGKRDNVVVCTKVGIARPSGSNFVGLLKPLLRGAIRLAPQLRPGIRAHVRSSSRLHITAQSIKESVFESLRELNVDYIDVLALHEPTVQEATDQTLYESLERLMESGHVRAIGIAGSLTSARAAIATFPKLHFVQLADNPFLRQLDQLSLSPAAKSHLIYLTHSVFGVAGALMRMEKVLQSRPDIRLRLISGCINKRNNNIHLFAEALLRYAFANNPRGPVIISMFDSLHMQTGVEFANANPDRQFKVLIDEALGGT